MQTPVSPENPLAFKFQWMNDKGQATGFTRTKGVFDGATLTLGDKELPVAIILGVVTRGERMVLNLPTEDGQVTGAGLVLTSKHVTDRLKEALDIARSATWAEQHRKQLAAKGAGHRYRDAKCPNCGATVVLSDMPKSPQLYCTFCETLSFTDGNDVPVEQLRHYRLCDDCGMFSKPRKFTIFYFYFLLVIYGWHSRTTWRCPACMRPDAWKMLFGNMPFVLGLPVAMTQLARSYGGDVGGGPFAGLDAGNRAARAGNFPQAIEKYRTILDRQGHAAGVKYNLGLSLLNQGDKRRAAETFRLSLEDCANYAPAYHRLRGLYEELGEKDELAELKAMWEDAEEQAEEVEAS
jgi:tetratricopeptide (TPR) repeat protein